MTLPPAEQGSQPLSADRLSGFLLTRQWREHRSGLRLIYWVHSAQGPVRIEITDQETVSFVRTDDRVAVETLLSASSGWRLRPLTLKSFFNEPVLGLYCKSQRLLSQCRDLLQQKGIPLALERHMGGSSGIGIPERPP